MKKEWADRHTYRKAPSDGLYTLWQNCINYITTNKNLSASVMSSTEGRRYLISVGVFRGIVSGCRHPEGRNCSCSFSHTFANHLQPLVHTVNIYHWTTGRLCHPYEPYPRKGCCTPICLRHSGSCHGCARVKQYTSIQDFICSLHIHSGLPQLLTITSTSEELWITTFLCQYFRNLDI